jgi:hypothetical protein
MAREKLGAIYEEVGRRALGQQVYVMVTGGVYAPLA